MLVIYYKIVNPTYFYSFLNILCGTVLSLAHVNWKSRHVGQFLIVSSMLEFILPRIWTQMPVALSFLCQCDLDAVLSVFFLVIMQVLLFFYPLW